MTNTYLLTATDDSSSAVSLVLAGGEAVDSLVRCFTDLGGEVHALAFVAGPASLVGFVSLPDNEAAVAASAYQSYLGRRLELTPVVDVGGFDSLMTAVRRISLPTASGDDDVESP